MKLRDRIKSLRRVRAKDLRPSPKNWRVHNAAQQDALRGVLAEVGIADALLARELPDGSLMLIDGHLRADVDPDVKWPVLILDVTEAEADLLLATVDPLAAMAEADPAKVAELLAGVESTSDAVQALLDGLGADVGIFADAANDPNAEWQGMPEFENEDLTSARIIHVHFKSDKDVQRFAKAIGQRLTDKTHSTWFPPVKDTDDVSEQYVEVGGE